MATQPMLESEARQTNQNHHGPFYRSAELVAAVHRAEGGIFETFRAAHAFGRIYEGRLPLLQLQKSSLVL